MKIAKRAKKHCCLNRKQLIVDVTVSLNPMAYRRFGQPKLRILLNSHSNKLMEPVLGEECQSMSMLRVVVVASYQP